MGTAVAVAENVTGAAAPAETFTCCGPAAPKRQQGSAACPLRPVVVLVGDGPAATRDANVTGTPSVGWPNWFSTDTVTFWSAKLPANPVWLSPSTLFTAGDDQGWAVALKVTGAIAEFWTVAVSGVRVRGAQAPAAHRGDADCRWCSWSAPAPDTLPPPEATVKTTCAPGTGYWPSVTVTEGATGSRLCCTQV